MNSRRLACLFIGLWLGASMLMVWVGADSFRSVDRTLARSTPELSPVLKTLGVDSTRKLLRHQVSEQNRAAFANWEVAQVFLGMGFFGYLLFLTKEGKLAMGIVLAMLAVVFVQWLALTPELTALGRNIDFAAYGAMPKERSQFWVLHSSYMGMEVLKAILGLGLAVKLSFGRGARSGDSRKNLDPIDKRDHRHIDR